MPLWLGRTHSCAGQGCRVHMPVPSLLYFTAYTPDHAFSALRHTCPFVLQLAWLKTCIATLFVLLPPFNTAHVAFTFHVWPLLSLGAFLLSMFSHCFRWVLACFPCLAAAFIRCFVNVHRKLWRVSTPTLTQKRLHCRSPACPAWAYPP